MEERVFYWGISGDGSVVMSDDVKIIKQGCAKSFAPFPTGKAKTQACNIMREYLRV